MLLASALFACMGVCVKLAASLHSPAELVFWRSAVSLLLLYPWIRYRQGSLATPQARFQVQRALSGLVALMLSFYAISRLPLALAVTLNYTSPLWLALWMMAITRRRPPLALLLVLLSGLAGVVLLLRPSLDHVDAWGAAAGLGAGLLSGLAYFNVKELALRGEPEWRTVFYFALLSTGLALPWAALSGGLHAPTWASGLELLGVGVFATLAQLAMTRAYTRGKALVVGAMSYATVVFSSLFGVLLWAEFLPPSAWFAMVIIAGSGLGATRLSSRAHG